MTADSKTSSTPELRIAVVTPTRLQRIGGTDDGELFVERAMRSALAQVCEQTVKITFVVGVDAGADVPASLSSRADTVIAHSEGRSQILALNAALKMVGPEFHFVTFLEDDDRWQPNYLTWVFAALTQYDFVSSTQLEVDENDQIIRINDFPTPSGWIMPYSTLNRVGHVDVRSKWHYDNEWLGRLAECGLSRCHLVEVTAPVTLATSHQSRPWIANVIRNGGPRIAVQRHPSTVPLVIRQMHSGSGSTAVATNNIAQLESKNEYAALVERYGRIPW
ncbi:MAG: glycosyltransferase family A protein [Beijerinckiaceae bacterium]|jgi:hypothetical protein